MSADYLHGDPLMIDHTPSSDVAAGEIVNVGGSARIAKQDIAADKLGALAVSGGVFSVDKAAGGSTALAAGALVDVDISAQTAVATTTGDTHLGEVAKAAGDSDTKVEVILGKTR